MLKFEIKTKNHMGDKRTYLTYETENVAEVLAAFGWESFSKDQVENLYDGKFHFFQRTTGVRIVNIEEIKEYLPAL
jgi:hypothetical protein